MKLRVRVEARNADGTLVGIDEAPDISVKALAQLIQTNILNTSQTVTDVTNAARSISANSASTAIYVVAGLTGTAAAFADYALGDGTAHTDYKSNSSYAQSGTVNAISGTTFTITATITNVSGGNLLYKEVGFSCTSATFQFLLAHDQVNGGTGYTVSNNGTLAVTYTLTFT